MDDAQVTLDWARVGANGSVTLTVKLGAEVLAAERLDVLNPTKRDDFAARLTSKCPSIDRDAVAAKLLEIAADVVAKPERPASDFGVDLDNTQIARPELFHAREVSGVAIPAIRLDSGKPAGRWDLLLRWHANGHRERRELSATLELSGGARLWLHPMPVEPTLSTRSPWSAPGRDAWLEGRPSPDPVGVLQRLCDRFARFLDFPPDTAEGATATLALWTLLTYAYPAWPCVPYLSVGGPMASGKTTLFRVLARLVFRPLESSNTTAPCLFRTLHDRGGTLLLDEAERLRDGTPEAGELRSILLSGYKRGSPAMRLEKVGDGFRRTEFDAYGPKALAAIASMPEALASRCIRLTMFRAAPNSPKPRRRIDHDADSWAVLRDDLHALALEHGATWLELAQRDACPTALSGRDFELWAPLFALTLWLEERGASGLLGVLTDFAMATADAARDDAAPEADEALLRILANHVHDGTAGTLKPGDVLREAREADPVTFKGWSAKGVASVLARYALRTHRGHGNAGRTYARVTVDSLRRICAAYGFDLPLPASQASHVSRPVACVAESRTSMNPDPAAIRRDTCDACSGA